MKIFDFNWFELKSEEPLALTIGTFDGVHKGHQSILKSVVEKAHQKGLKSAILTFSNHPRLLLNPHAKGIEILQTAKEKLSVFEEVGIDMVFYLDLLPGIFDFEAHRFVEEIIIEKLQAQFVCIGYDHRFGKNRGGDIHLLKQFQSNFEVLQIPVLEEEAIAISSTRIREALRDGKVQEANALLGRKYPLTGQIIHGNQWGRTIGFPTANIQLDHPQKLIPKVGIYAAEVYLPSFKKYFFGMLYIGYRTGLDGQEKRIEVHLFDFDEEIYGQEIQVQMHAFIREDQVVTSLSELIPLLDKDKKNVLEFFAKQNFVA
jgi:riboflavin kinase / FMN adenylyltransferase